MHLLIAFGAALAAILYFLIRARYAVREVRELDRDTKMLQHRARNGIERLIGSPLSRIRDPRLAATILMIQLVRTGSPITAAERSTIHANMRDRMQVEDTEAMFRRAFGYTRERAFFSIFAEELGPLLRSKLDAQERADLLDMLSEVASAYGEASKLQAGSLVRMRKILDR